MKSIIKNIDKSKKNQGLWWQPALMIFFRLSAWIVAPIILAAYLGKWLDEKYNTDPWMFLGTVAVAFTVSMIGLIKTAVEEFKKIDKNKNFAELKSESTATKSRSNHKNND